MARSYTATTTASELADILAPEIRGRVVLTAGVSPSTIGSTFVETIAKAHPALLILAGRSTAKLEKTASEIRNAQPEVQVRLLGLDLGSLSAVRRSAAEVVTWDDVPHIGVLVNNAGIMATDFKLSPEGIESQLATNHLGHFLFTNLIMGKILGFSSPRVVSISSDGHRLSPIRWGDYNFQWYAYGQSKTDNTLFAVSLARKFGPTRGLLAFSLHPGVILETSLGSHIDWNTDFEAMRAVDQALGNIEGWDDEFNTKTLDQGAATHVYAAFESSLKDHNGAYLQDSRLADPWKDTIKPWATEPLEAERLWKLSEDLVGETFNY